LCRIARRATPKIGTSRQWRNTPRRGRRLQSHKVRPNSNAAPKPLLRTAQTPRNNRRIRSPFDRSAFQLASGSAPAILLKAESATGRPSGRCAHQPRRMRKGGLVLRLRHHFLRLVGAAHTLRRAPSREGLGADPVAQAIPPLKKSRCCHSKSHRAACARAQSPLPAKKNFE
jgi:hypothetical protein